MYDNVSMCMCMRLNVSIETQSGQWIPNKFRIKKHDVIGILIKELQFVMPLQCFCKFGIWNKIRECCVR